MVLKLFAALQPNNRRHVLGDNIAFFQSFDVDLYLYMSWRDPSLNHTDGEYIMINDHNVIQQIWVPDLYFANARISKFHTVTVPNFNFFIYKDGTIAYSTRFVRNKY
jgi:hypothetical protein